MQDGMEVSCKKSTQVALAVSVYTVYHETFVAGNFHGFRCFSYHRESFMPNNFHLRHNP